MPVNLGLLSVFLILGIVGGMAIMPGDARANGAASDLPHAEGRDFTTLDAYLAHLEKLGEIGITWYERMPDGQYRLIRRRMPGSEPEIFTRQELLDRFGFQE